METDSNSPERAELEAAGLLPGPEAPNTDDGFPGGSPPGDGAPPPPRPSDPTNSQKAAAVIGLIEAATFVIVKAFAAAKGVPLTDDLADVAKLSPDEKQTLAPFAPSAYPWIIRVLGNLEIVMAGAFGALWVMMLAQRISIIKERTPVKVEAKIKNAPAPAASVAPNAGA